MCDFLNEHLNFDYLNKRFSRFLLLINFNLKKHKQKYTQFEKINLASTMTEVEANISANKEEEEKDEEESVYSDPNGEIDLVF